MPQPGQGCLYNNAKQVSITRAQQNFVIQVRSSLRDDLGVDASPSRFFSTCCATPTVVSPQVETGSGEIEYIWTGDRWMQVRLSIEVVAAANSTGVDTANALLQSGAGAGWNQRTRASILGEA
jgi:hypothetical protein